MCISVVVLQLAEVRMLYIACRLQLGNWEQSPGLHQWNRFPSLSSFVLCPVTTPLPHFPQCDELRARSGWQGVLEVHIKISLCGLFSGLEA